MTQKGWWYLGVGTEIFHIFFAFAVLIFGRLWMPEYLVNLAITITVMGQIMFLWCPLSVFSNYCFCKYDPERVNVPGLTFYLYGKFGPIVGIPIFIVLVVISGLVGAMMTKIP